MPAQPPSDKKDSGALGGWGNVQRRCLASGPSDGPRTRLLTGSAFGKPGRGEGL